MNCSLCHSSSVMILECFDRKKKKKFHLNLVGWLVIEGLPFNIYTLYGCQGEPEHPEGVLRDVMPAGQKDKNLYTIIYFQDSWLDYKIALNLTDLLLELILHFSLILPDALSYKHTNVHRHFKYICIFILSWLNVCLNFFFFKYIAKI